jgi:hypothetical protein
MQKKECYQKHQQPPPPHQACCIKRVCKMASTSSAPFFLFCFFFFAEVRTSTTTTTLCNHIKTFRVVFHHHDKQSEFFWGISTPSFFLASAVMWSCDPSCVTLSFSRFFRQFPLSTKPPPHHHLSGLFCVCASMISPVSGQNCNSLCFGFGFGFGSVSLRHSARALCVSFRWQCVERYQSHRYQQQSATAPSTFIDKQQSSSLCLATVLRVLFFCKCNHRNTILCHISRNGPRRHPQRSTVSASASVRALHHLHR